MPARRERSPVNFLRSPLWIWVACGCGAGAGATAIFLLSGISIHGTLHGVGPFATGSANVSLLILQAFMGVNTVMALLLAAVVAERRRTEERLKNLAISDSVTGLANHRRFIELMEQGINRSQRADR